MHCFIIGLAALFVGLFQDCLLAQEVTPLPPAYQEKYRAAVDAFNKEKYTESLALLAEADTISPNQIATFNLQGAAHVKRRDFQKAAVSFRKILEKEPQNPIAFFNYGEVLFLSENYPQAKEAFIKYLGTEGNEKNALGRFKVLLCDLRMGNIQEVKAVVDNLRPTISHPLEYFARAAIEFSQNNEKEARSYVQSAFQIYPGGMNLAFADSFVELGWIGRGDVAQIGAVNAAALQSLSREFQPEDDPGEDTSFKEKFRSLLPSLGGTPGSESEEKE